jgi:hypothetical protein
MTATGAPGTRRGTGANDTLALYSTLDGSRRGRLPVVSVEAKAEPAKKQRRFPLGLVIVLGLYTAMVLGYLQASYWGTPEYQAAKHYAAALVLLGSDDGRTCSERALREGLELLTEAARLHPADPGLAKHLEHLRWRFDERHLALSAEQIRSIELVSASARRADEARAGWLPIGAHDRGWAPEQLLMSTQTVMLWSIPGFVLIIALWGYTQWSSRAARAREHEAELRRLEHEIEELGDFRRVVRGPPAPKRKP